MNRLAMVVIAWGALAGPLCAQTPEERAEIGAFRDSLDGITDVPALASIAAREKAASPAGDREMRRLRHGWALVRLAQMADSAPPAIDAAMEFYEAGVRRGRWPEAWFGMGAAKTTLDGMGVREYRSAHQPAGNGWRQGAILAFMDALRLDPDFRAAAVEAAKLTVRDDEVAIRPGLQRAVEHAVELAPDDVQGWFLLGRLYRRIDQDTEAARAYGRALALGGATSGIAALELARELFWIGKPDSGTLVYYQGAASGEADAVSAYRKDLAMIAPVEELAAWDSLLPAARPAWLRDFWHRREAESGRAADSRLPAHERRWRVAYERYRLIPTWTHQYQFGMPFRSGNDEIDDRGIIYIRHGDPDERIPHFSGYGEEPAETWVYWRSDGDMIFHFKLANTDPHQPAVSGWRAVESITAIKNANVLPNIIGVNAIYMSMSLAAMGRSPSNLRESPLQARERLMVRASLDRGTTTDSDPLHFNRQLSPIVQAYGVGGTSPGSGRVLVVWAMAGREAPRVGAPPGVTGALYAVRIRAYVTDSSGSVLATLDTLRRFRSATPLRPEEFLSGSFLLDVPAGTVRAQVTLADSAEGLGALVVVSGIPVPRFSGGPEISDLVLGLEGQTTAWVRDGTRFSLNPRNAWTTSEAIEIGFELAGVAAGTPYKVRLGVSDIGADSTAPPRASVEFDQVARGGRELVTQSLGLRTIAPGRYLLTAVVTVADRALRRERWITVAGAR